MTIVSLTIDFSINLIYSRSLETVTKELAVLWKFLNRYQMLNGYGSNLGGNAETNDDKSGASHAASATPAFAGAPCFLDYQLRVYDRRFGYIDITFVVRSQNIYLLSYTNRKQRSQTQRINFRSKSLSNGDFILIGRRT